MKKTVFALAAGLLCATASPALAANNPFQDVPKDHWSYDAVTQLAADGILEGYGDGNFRGNQALTRYEMAQMIARAMAKENIPAADQNLLDKLAAEYQDELKNLGVRVGNLEHNADTTKFSGYLYLREQNQHIKNKHTGKSTRSTVNRAWFDLISQSQVNKNWKVVTEANTIVDLNKDKTDDTYDLYFASMFADGTYGKFHTQLGRIDNFSQDGGVVMHNPISGGKFTFGNKLRTTLTAARVSCSSLPSLNSDESFDFGAAELAYPASKATNLYGAFYQLHDDKFKATRGSESPSIYTLGFRSTIAKNLVLTGYYLKASDTTAAHTKDTGWVGAPGDRRVKLDQPGTWSLYTKYANIPESPRSTSIPAISAITRDSRSAASTSPRRTSARICVITTAKMLKTRPSRRILCAARSASSSKCISHTEQYPSFLSFADYSPPLACSQGGLFFVMSESSASGHE